MDEDIKVAQLVSLLDIDVASARHALGEAAWDLDRAVRGFFARRLRLSGMSGGSRGACIDLEEEDAESPACAGSGASSSGAPGPPAPAGPSPPRGSGAPRRSAPARPGGGDRAPSARVAAPSGPSRGSLPLEEEGGEKREPDSKRRRVALAEAPPPEDPPALGVAAAPCAVLQTPWQLFRPLGSNLMAMLWRERAFDYDPPDLPLQSDIRTRRRDADETAAALSLHKFPVERKFDLAHLLCKVDQPSRLTSVAEWARQVELQECGEFPWREVFKCIAKHCRFRPVDLRCEWRLLGGRPDLRADEVLPPGLRGPSLQRFQLRNSLDYALAPQPPRFTHHPLRPDQLRSLTWMLGQENGSRRFEVEWRMWSREIRVGLDARVCAQYPVRGGILADQIGYGKTATMIGLMDATRDRPDPEVPEADRGSFFPTGATLILVPSNLLGQWVREIKKFLAGDDGLDEELHPSRVPGQRAPDAPGWSKIHGGWVRKGDRCPWNILVLKNVYHLKNDTSDEIAQADVVNATYRVLWSPFYENRRKQLTANHEVEGTWLYGDNRMKYNLSAVPEGGLRFDQTHTSGKKLSGWLSPLDGWYQGKLFEQVCVGPEQMAQGPEFCTIRLRLGKARAEVVLMTYFMGVGETVWGDGLVARRDGRSTELWKVGSVTKSHQSQQSFRSGPVKFKFPLLEQFWWRRVVFDEFHELATESFSTKQNVLQHLRSHYRWGLTGTPPLTNTGVIFMSSLFRLELPGWRHCAADWASDPHLSRGCQRFLDEFARQNEARVEHIRLLEHTVSVRMTQRERVIYLAQARDAGVPFGVDFAPRRCEAHERLLKICSHFQVGGEHNASADADAECSRIFQQKEARVVRAQNQVARCWQACLLLQKMAAAGGRRWREPLDEALSAAEWGSDHSKEAAAHCRREEASAHRHAVAGTWHQALEHHRPRAEELRDWLGPPSPEGGMLAGWRQLEGAKGRDLGQGELAGFLDGQAREQIANLRELGEARSSLEFFRRTLRLLQDDAGSGERQCCVCMDDGLSLAQMAITPCSHAFCLACLRETVRKFRACSICRAALTERDVVPLVNEIAAAGASTSGGPPPRARGTARSSPLW